MTIHLSLSSYNQPGQLRRLIIGLAAPAVAENVLLTAVTLTDTLMVGWLHSSAALAAVAMGSFLNFILTSLFTSLSIACTSFVARFWGAGDQSKARQYLGQTFSLAIVSGLTIALLGYFFAEPVLSLMGLQQQAVSEGVFYFRLLLLANVFAFPSIVLFGALRGAGDTRTPLFITGGANLLHIVLALLLIFGWGFFPALGVKGAGWATAIATALSGIVVFFVVWVGRGEFYLRIPHLRLHSSMLKEILRLAAPAFSEALVFRGAQLIFIRLVSALGEIPLAAHQVALSIESLSYMPGWGFAVASTTLAGQFLGAKRPDLVGKSVWQTTWMGLLVLSSFGLLFGLLGNQIASLFGGTPEVIKQAGLAIRLGGLEQPGLAVLMIIAGALRGAGDTRSPLIGTIVGVLIGRLLLVYLLAFPLKMGLAGVWLATAVDWSLRAIVVLWFFLKGRWRTERPASIGKNLPPV